MARRTEGRLVLRGTLRFLEPFLVAADQPDAGEDSSPARNGNDALIIPGTSLTGVLRTWCGQYLPGGSNTEEKFFGTVGSDGFDHGSYIRVEDIVVDNASIETVDGVGINRVTGAAHEHVKFDRTVVRAGATAELRVVCEIPSGAAMESERVMKEVARALDSGLLRIGSGTTKGFGQCTTATDHSTSSLRLVSQPLDRAGVISRLSAPAGTDQGAEVTLPEPGVDPANTSLTVTFASTSPTFVKSSTNGSVVDVLPRVDIVSGVPCLVIPGTSLRGVLRSECERIVRTVLRRNRKSPADDTNLHGWIEHDTPHTRQVRERLVDIMFGISPESVSNEIFLSLDATLGRACVTVPSMYAPLGQETSAENWAKILRAATAKKAEKDSEDERSERERKLTKLIEKSGSPLLFTHHVPLDRWTSGTVASLLFTVLEPHVEEWRPVTLVLDENRLDCIDARNPQTELTRTMSLTLPAVALLLLALESLHNGSIGLGWGTHRGHGSVRVASIDICVNGMKVKGLSVHPTATILETLGKHPDGQELLEQLRVAWTTWLANESEGLSE